MSQTYARWAGGLMVLLGVRALAAWEWLGPKAVLGILPGLLLTLPNSGSGFLLAGCAFRLPAADAVPALARRLGMFAARLPDGLRLLTSAVYSLARVHEAKAGTSMPAPLTLPA